MSGQAPHVHLAAIKGYPHVKRKAVATLPSRVLRAWTSDGQQSRPPPRLAENGRGRHVQRARLERRRQGSRRRVRSVARAPWPGTRGPMRCGKHDFMLNASPDKAKPQPEVRSRRVRP